MLLGGSIQPVLYQAGDHFTNSNILGSRLVQAPSGRGAENRLLRSREPCGFISPLLPPPSVYIASSTHRHVSYLSPTFLVSTT